MFFLVSKSPPPPLPVCVKVLGTGGLSLGVGTLCGRNTGQHLYLPVQGARYSVQCTVGNLQFTVYCLQFTVYSLKFTVYIL